MTHFPTPIAAAVALLWCVAPAALAQIPIDYNAEVTRQVDTMYPWLEADYQDLHANPELGFAEVRTAAKLAAEMRELGFAVTERVGKTGLVAIFKNGAGPTVLVRTEMDGLPMEEKSGMSYASKKRGMLDGRDTPVAHSCGHDVHMAGWLGTARTLVAMKARWKGTLMFIAQPSEETVAGAKAMLEDGLFTRFNKPDLAFALHSVPAAYGTIGYNVGPVTSNADALELTFRGRGGHGAAPHMTIDPIAIASRFVVDVQAVISREKNPMQFGVVTIGAFHSGSVGNIIPDQATLRGTIRSYDPAVRARMLDGIRRTANASAMMAGAPQPELSILAGGMAVMNNEDLVARTATVLKSAFGAGNVALTPALPASEDFSVFVNEGIPSMFFFVGVYDPKMVADSQVPGGKPLAINHSPYYAPVPEPSIKTSVRAMSLAVLNVMDH